MVSDPPSLGEREEPPPPVKKRGRYSHSNSADLLVSASQTLTHQPTHHSDVPEGFVRYELDEEDSDDDPDFEAEHEALDEDDDDDPYDATEPAFQALADDEQRADAEMSMILRHGRVADSARTQAPEQPPVAFSATTRGSLQRDSGERFVDAGFQRHEGTQPHFDVDDLDSTDEDDFDPDDTSPDAEVKNHTPSPTEGPGIFGPAGEDVGDGSEVEDVDDADLDEDEGDGEAEDAVEGAGDEYMQFLMGLISDDGNTPGTAEIASSEAAGNAPTLPTGANAPGGSDAQKWAMDDDDDFDYLRESARVQDDPLEYRDDLHVSRKELVQLLFNSRETNLRRHTRKSRTRHAQNSSRRRQITGVPPTTLFPATNFVPTKIPSSTVPFVPAVVSSPQVGKAVPAVSLSRILPHQTVVASPHAPYASFINLPAASLYQFREQLSVHLQILTTIHAETQAKCRLEREQSAAWAESSDAAQEAAKRSEVLIRRLIQNKRISSAYHETIGTNMSRLKAFSERLLHRDKTSPFTYESCKSSAYDLPALDLLPGFLNDCTSTNLSNMPAEVLQRFQQFNRSDISQALHARPQRRQYSSSMLRPGWFAWTVQDDTLLAMTMAKYGSEFGEFSTDLLPHRQEDDCQNRVRYLSSRRCPDNPVKRQAMFIASPLSRDEAELVRRGLELFGRGGADDPAVWKRIQSELLPNREWSHLQKLWTWRETRRKYNAKYRARANQKKRALREGAAQA